MLDLVKMLDHACIVESIRPKARHQEAKEVEQSQSSHQLRKQIQHVEATNVDRVLHWVLPDVDGKREARV